jgi:hypothetical protein
MAEKTKTLTSIAIGFFVAGLWFSDLASADPTNQQRATAARRTVAKNSLCSARKLDSFYWEVGDLNGALVSGSVVNRNGAPKVTRDTTLSIASSSKWIYSSYVIEKVGDDPAGRPFLNLTSGYSNFRSSECPTDGTVADCNPGSIDQFEADNHVFHYDGGHMQKHANDFGLGPLVNASLATEIGDVIGSGSTIAYLQPALAGGVSTTARAYATILRKFLVGAASPLKLGDLLGSNPVCTYPSDTCNASKLVALQEAWHYSLGHWIEDDPTGTPPLNFAYSSPGSFGFYPWVDIDRNLYGILARQTGAFTGKDEGYASTQCGRLIRLAWKTGIVQ